ncbi:MAG: cysteine methyltransferase [Ferruginibacter sp.]|nr:cysteine methyltransferase [Ferruginibacter sp.]
MFIYVSCSKKLYFVQFNKHSSKFFNIFLMPILNSFFSSPVGLIEIRTTGDAISAVLFAHTLKHPANPMETMETQHPGHPLLTACTMQLKEYFEGKRMHFDLPLQQQGSAFQQTVWTALCEIPYGRTISYLELSKRIGNVKAIRAAGTANGSNAISIIVPCHRVIGSNGSLTGYGGDLWRKKWLLEHEGKFANGVQKLFDL